MDRSLADSPWGSIESDTTEMIESITHSTQSSEFPLVCTDWPGGGAKPAPEF